MRNTPGEEAMRDFLATHADLPRGAEDAIQRYILRVERNRSARERGRL